MNDEQACSKKYMQTRTEYNSNVYDLYANYDKIPSNNKLPDTNDINQLLKRTLPACKKGYFKLKSEKISPENKIQIQTDYQIYNETIQYILKPSDLLNTTHTLINNDGNLIKNGENCNPQTPTIILGNKLEEGVSRIILEGKNLKYNIYNNKNQLLYSSYNNNINLKQIPNENTIYITLDLNMDSFFTCFKMYSYNLMKIAKI
jgi:hypothetical protein